MSNFTIFLDAWEQPDHPDNESTVVLFTTPFGNINDTGELGNYGGHALTRWQSQFENALEPGIKELALIMVNNFDWITYTSCQGHYYGHQSLSPVERHVGIVPRSDSEAALIHCVLGDVYKAFDRYYRYRPVYLEVLDLTLESEGQMYPAIDFFFRRRWYVSWGMYFKWLNEIYATVVDIFRNIAPQK